MATPLVGDAKSQFEAIHQPSHPRHLIPKPERIALFITCLTDQFYPTTGIAVVKILEHFGVKVEFPSDQTCCGQPFFNNGFMPETKKLAQRMIELFEPFPAIVSPSGSCCAMLREQYLELFHDDPVWLERAKKLAHKSYEFVEFLTYILKVDLKPFALPTKEKITFHYTCHGRGLGLTTEATTLLQQLGNVDFVPLNKTEQCCGFGGTFALKYPAISGAMVQDKLDNLKETGASTAICNDAGCTMNIAGMCNRHQVDVKIRHIADVIAQAMKIDTTKL
jgi:L-lactate dehydrogenase complex protein LldE